MFLRVFVLATVFQLVASTSIAQFSIATDASVMRQFNQHQKFWAFGQTVQVNFPLSDKDALYASVSYYTPGRFKNRFEAIAREPAVSPQQISYITYSALRYRHFSAGWKHYFTGAYNEETTWSLYGVAGFGLLMGRATNSTSISVDTIQYKVKSPAIGSANFQRLTFDAAIGIDLPVSTGIFLYTELRTWIPTTRYPSPYLHPDNYHVPAVGIVNLGIRLLIE